MKKKKIIAILKYLFFLGIGIFLMWWQISKMTPAEKIQFRDSLQHARYFLLLPLVIIALLSHLSRAMRWKIMIRQMNYHSSTANTFYATLCGYFANTFIPRGGEILRCTLLARYEKIPANKLIGTVLVERIFDLVCYLLLVLITIAVQFDTVSSLIRNKMQLLENTNWTFSWWIIIVVVVLALLVFIFLVKWVLKKYANHHYIIQLKGHHIGLREGIYTILHLKKRKAFFFHTLFIWLMYFLGIYIGFYAISATSGLGIGAALSVLSLTTLAMIVAPGGIGAFPVAVQQVLIIYSIENISYGWFTWGVTTGVIIVFGIISFFLLMSTHKKQNHAPVT